MVGRDGEWRGAKNGEWRWQNEWGSFRLRVNVETFNLKDQGMLGRVICGVMCKVQGGLLALAWVGWEKAGCF